MEQLAEEVKTEKTEDFNLVAVYGTLKEGHHNHYCLGESILLGECWTEPIFTMYSLGGFPALTLNGTTSIKIEVYKVINKRDLARVYSLEGYNGVRGDEDNTFYDTTDVDTEWGKAEIFYMKRDLSRYSEIKDGNWRR